MKREFIKGQLPDIGDDVLKQIMDQHSTDVGALRSKIEALETERDGLKTQLNDANTEIQSYKDMDIDGIKQKAADWENKYNTDTQALKDKLSEQEYSYAVNGNKFVILVAGIGQGIIYNLVVFHSVTIRQVLFTKFVQCLFSLLLIGYA